MFLHYYDRIFTRFYIYFKNDNNILYRSYLSLNSQSIRQRLTSHNSTSQYNSRMDAWLNSWRCVRNRCTLNEVGELTLFPRGPGGPFSPEGPGEPCVGRQRQQIEDPETLSLHLTDISALLHFLTYRFSLFTIFSSISLGTILTLK